MNCSSLTSELAYYGPDDLGLNSSKAGEFSLHRIQTGFGVHTACSPVDIGCYFGKNIKLTIRPPTLLKLITEGYSSTSVGYTFVERYLDSRAVLFLTFHKLYMFVV
jgi:hypothetical protein